MFQPRASRGRALIAAMCVAGMELSGVAHANPQGADIRAGAVSITGEGSNVLTVKQTTPQAIIDWQSFSIGAGDHTIFDQPSTSSVALNRVVGADPSVILGRLSSNGKIFLVNERGILFSTTAKLDVGGLVASTLNIANDAFLQGKYDFHDLNGTSGSIEQLGEIGTSEGGSVFLLGQSVSNAGVILARVGNVTLASGQHMSVDLDGDGLVSYVMPASAGAPIPSAQVANTGTLSGATVALTTAAARGILNSSVSAGGNIMAQSASVAGGKIILDGGNSGVVTVAANAVLSARGANGGEISVSGYGIAVAGQLDADGVQKGGRIDIGNATSATVDVLGTSIISASTSGAAGAGGQIRLETGGTIGVAGLLKAKPGLNSGNGGVVDVVSRGSLSFTATSDAGAPSRKPAVRLHAPDIYMCAGSKCGGAPDGAWVLSPDDVLSMLQVSASGLAFVAGNDLTVASAIMGDSSSPLSLRAGRSVSLLAGLSLPTDIDIIANSTLCPVSGVSCAEASTRGDGLGGLNIARGASIDAGVGKLSLLLSDGDGVANALGGNVEINAPLKGSTITVQNSAAVDQIHNQAPVFGRIQLLQHAELWATSTAPGKTIVLSATGSFSNEASAEGNVLNTGGGSFAIYAWSWIDGNPGGLAGVNLYNRTLASTPPTGLAVGSNHFVYGDQPVLTFAANTASWIYGDNPPVLGFSNPTGLVNDDSAAAVYAGLPFVSLASGLGKQTGVGTYNGGVNIGIGSLVSDAGYAFSFQPASVTVTPATLVVTPNNVTRTYGDPNPVLSGQITGFKNAENSSVLTAQPVYSTVAGAASNVADGPFAIVASGGLATNYVFDYRSGLLSITPATLTIQANDLRREYGDPNPPLKVSVSGLKLDQKIDDVSSGQPLISTSATMGSDIGSYRISLKQGDFQLLNTNYVLNLVNGTLLVEQAPLQLFFRDAVVNQGGDYIPVIDVVGLKLGQSVIDVLERFVIQTIYDEACGCTLNSVTSREAPLSLSTSGHSSSIGATRPVSYFPQEWGRLASGTYALGLDVSALAPSNYRVVVIQDVNRTGKVIVLSSSANPIVRGTTVYVGPKGSGKTVVSSTSRVRVSQGSSTTAAPIVVVDTSSSNANLLGRAPVAPAARSATGATPSSSGGGADGRSSSVGDSAGSQPVTERSPVERVIVGAMALFDWEDQGESEDRSKWLCRMFGECDEPRTETPGRPG